MSRTAEEKPHTKPEYAPQQQQQQQQFPQHTVIVGHTVYRGTADDVKRQQQQQQTQL